MLSSTALLISCIVAALVATGLLVPGIRVLLRWSAAHELAVLPVQATQTVSLTGPGTVVLALRGVQFQRGFGGATFTFKSAATGHEVASEAVMVRGKRSSLTAVATLSVRRFAVPHAGDFVLEARGLLPGLEGSDARFVLARPCGPLLVGQILWVVGAAVLLLTAIVVAVLAGTGNLGKP